MFSMSKIVCADARGKACKICAIGTPQYGGKKERLCFIKGKSKAFLSKSRIFRKENRTIILHFRNAHKNTWTFSRSTTCFAKNPALFCGKQSSLFCTLTSRPFPHAQGHVRTDTPPRIAHSASSHFLPSPFTTPSNQLIIGHLRVKKTPILTLHR